MSALSRRDRSSVNDDDDERACCDCWECGASNCRDAWARGKEEEEEEVLDSNPSVAAMARETMLGPFLP